MLSCGVDNGSQIYATLLLIGKTASPPWEGRLALSSPFRILANNDNIFNNVCLSSTQIFGNLFACHHDETVYPDPWEFKPDRFLEEGKLVGADHPAVRKYVWHYFIFFYCIGIILRYDYAEFSSIDIFKSVYFLHFSFIGFGVGRRRCVGQQMARIRMFLYTTCLLQKFKIEVPKDTSLPSHDPRALLSESPVILPPPMQYCFVECWTWMLEISVYRDRLWMKVLLCIIHGLSIAFIF